MYKVTNPKTNKTYTYSTAREADAHALAEKLGVKVEVVQASPTPRGKTYRKTSGSFYGKTCICGRKEESHESYDCYKDYRLTHGGY
jgi:hypothetical protein